MGKERNLHLLMVLMGLWHEYEIPYVLAENGLIDKSDCSRLEERLYAGADPEVILRGRVQQLYCKYYNPIGRLN